LLLYNYKNREIIKYNSSELPIVPAVVVVKNRYYKDLYRICKIFYEKLNCLPTINELSFKLFQSPNKKQIKELYKNIYRIVTDLSSKTNIKVFPYISPELCYGGKRNYVLELDMDNKHNLIKTNIEEKIPEVLKWLNINYPRLKCKNKNCEWKKECKYVKWVWENNRDKHILLKNKQKSYCIMKKTINNAFYDALKNYK